MHKYFLPIMIFLGLSLTISCDGDAIENEDFQLPITYNFDNVSYSGQTARLDMLAELTTEMKKANNGQTIDGAVLANMFANENSPFADSELNSTTKQLKNKCYSAQGAAYNDFVFEYMMGRLAAKSVDAGNTWAPNQAGVATSGSKAYFFDEYGVEYTQIIEKGLMGAIFYYQAAESYTRESKIGTGVDNTTVTDGKGTDMEHHWDEAFGYFGAPKDLKGSNIEIKIDNGEARYHAKYSEVGQLVGLNTTDKVMIQFIKGRWAISNKNNEMKNEAAAQVRAEWEMVLATTAIHYLNSAQANFSDDALRNHALSEAYAFIMSLHYNSDKLISTTDLLATLGLFETTPPGSPQPVPYFLDVTTGDLTTAKNNLSSVYGLDAVKDGL
ncbi:MAG: DUF4856 domain-containing protein [Chitinophagales bacterium]